MKRYIVLLLVASMGTGLFAKCRSCKGGTCEVGESKKSSKQETRSGGATIKEVNLSALKGEIQSGSVIVDFYAPWCGPCKALIKDMPKIAAKLPSHVRIIKVNADTDSTEATRSYRVKGFPTLVFYKEGKEVGRTSGYPGVEEIVSLAYEHLD